MAQVVAHRAEFEALNTNIVMVSFGTTYWATMWLQETQSPFPLLLDADRNVYRAFGLASSRRQSWGLANLSYYAQAIWQGRQLYGKRGDTNQLGGDFVVDNAGILQFIHPSHDPTDRPTVNTLLTTLRTLNQQAG